MSFMALSALSPERSPKRKSRLEVGEPAVELRLVELRENPAHLRAGLHSARDQVAPHHDRLRGGILDFEPLRLLREPEERLGVRRERRPPRVVRGGDSQETVDPHYLRREAANRPVGRMVLPHRKRTHVEPHERRYLLEEPLLVREPAQKRQRGLHAALVVSERADALLDRIVRRARGLPEVVAKDGESDEEVFRIVASPPRGKRVEAAERVVPDVAFRMPLRRLVASY